MNGMSFHFPFDSDIFIGSVLQLYSKVEFSTSPCISFQEEEWSEGKQET